ncbi:MAG TPA: sigma-70 family RNA polymerase sigma factor, partial [Polyangiaceae bacterium]
MSAPSSETDEELVARMSRADRAALATLYERHSPRLRAVALRILSDSNEVEDVVHDVFIEVWRRSADYSRERGSVSAWLGLRLRSRAIDRLRARRSRSETFDESFVHALADPSADAGRILEHGRLREALATMSEAERQVILLGYFAGLTSSEIGENVGLPVGTVKSRTRSALLKLRAFFDRERAGHEHA